jgi:hypothetical protein
MVVWWDIVGLERRGVRTGSVGVRRGGNEGESSK